MNELTLRQVLVHPLDMPMIPFVLAVISVMFIVVMAYLQMKHDPLDLRWLILDRPHRPSATKIAQLIALIVSTWGFVVLTLSNALTETYFIGYMCAWSGSAALDAYFNKGGRGSERRTDPVHPDPAEPDTPSPSGQSPTPTPAGANDPGRPSNPYDTDRG